MATRVESMPGAGGRTPVTSYPWDRWLDGSTWRLERGTDYKVATTAMRAYAYRAARARGVTIETVRSSDGQSLTLRRTTPEDARPESTEDAA